MLCSINDNPGMGSFRNNFGKLLHVNEYTIERLHKTYCKQIKQNTEFVDKRYPRYKEQLSC